MLKSFILIFVRNLQRNRIFSLTNIFGLALGLTCFTVILIFVERELSFDKFHRNPEKIVRVVKDFVNNDGTHIPDATTPPALASAIREALPEVDAVTRFFPNSMANRLYLLEYKNKRFYEKSLIRIDPNFFDVFDFQFVSGNKVDALKHIHSILITEHIAKKYFNNEDPIGKTIRMNLNNGTDFTVSAVLKDVPDNSHFTFDILIPYESGRNPDIDWERYNFYTYVRLKDGTIPSVFQSHVVDLFKKHQPNSINEFYVQSLTDIHLRSRLKWELGPNGDIFYVKILITIAIFIILLATINYVNLVTAQASKRAKEVGIKKVTGARSGILIRQFLFESFLTILIALAFSIILTSLLLPFTHEVLGYDLSAFLPHSQSIKLILPACVILIGVISGLYPAIYLSAFDPLKVLKGKFIQSRRGIHLRRVLVVFQFVVSTSLIIGALVVSRQLSFMQQRKLGFNQNNVLLLPNVRGGIGSPVLHPEGMLDEMEKISGVVRVARADGILGATNSTNGISTTDGNRIALNFIRADYDLLPTLELELKEGRNFSEDFASDTEGIILNEVAVAQLGLKKPFIGQQLLWDDDQGVSHKVNLIGIVKDFHFTSFHEAIRPFGFILEVGNGSTFFLKLQSPNLSQTLGEIEKIWIKHGSERPFEYSFQDEYTGALYLSEARFQKLFAGFTILAIVIASLGLFGLVTFITESKTKEIGIRKVLGASVNTILVFLSKDFLAMVFIALVIASPLAYFLMQNWLENFAYRINIDWSYFILAGIISMLISILTLSVQAVRAASANPVNSLKNE